MLTTSNFIIYVCLGVIIGAAYGATGYLFLTPTAKDPHPGRTSAILGAIGGGTLFTLAALMLSNAAVGMVALVLVGLICLLLGLRRP